MIKSTRIFLHNLSEFRLGTKSLFTLRLGTKYLFTLRRIVLTTCLSVKRYLVPKRSVKRDLVPKRNSDKLCKKILVLLIDKLCKKILVLLIAGMTQGAWANSPGVVRDNNAGVEFLMMEDPDLENSYRLLMDALQEDPFHPILRINLGFWHLKSEENEKAHKDFVAALKSFGGDQPELWQKFPEGAQKIIFATLFNLGVSSTILKKYDQALHYYQRALLFNKDSQEVKVNIELLLKQQKGEGEGESDQNQDPNDKNNKGDGKDQKDQKNQQDQGDKNKDQAPPKKPKKQKFKSKELTKADVRRFLEEIKAQEQKIRAKELQKGQKGLEKEHDKDW